MEKIEKIVKMIKERMSSGSTGVIKIEIILNQGGVRDCSYSYSHKIK